MRNGAVELHIESHLEGAHRLDVAVGQVGERDPGV